LYIVNEGEGATQGVHDASKTSLAMQISQDLSAQKQICDRELSSHNRTYVDRLSGTAAREEKDSISFHDVRGRREGERSA
jgi:hypothetical protein